MATFFGEVVVQPSRAFWDDEDYDSDDETVEKLDNRVLELRFPEQSRDLSVQLQLFIIVHGPLAAGFARTYLLHNELPVAQVHEVEKQNESIGKRKHKPSFIYALSDSIHICVCSADLNIKYAHQFADQISFWSRVSQQVMILTSKPIADYFHQNSSEALPASFIKSLQTDNFSGAQFCSDLEQPNIVAGIPAGVLSWCQVFHVPAVLYVCYTDSNTVDSLTAGPFLQLLTRFQPQLLRPVPHKQKLTYMGAEVTSNLYM